MQCFVAAGAGGNVNYAAVVAKISRSGCPPSVGSRLLKNHKKHCKNNRLKVRFGGRARPLSAALKALIF
jgi:hypothetical protein